MAAMAGYSPHTDDIALLMLRQTPGEPGDSEPDSASASGYRTAPNGAFTGRGGTRW